MNEGLWYVKTPDGDVDRLTLDQIDEAFNAGRIDENVMVLPPDGSRWARLGELAGIGSAADDPGSLSPTSLRPVAIEATDEMMASLARRKPRLGMIFGGVVALIALVGGGVVIKNSGLLKFIRSPAARVVAAAPPPVTVTPVVPPPPPAPSALESTAAPTSPPPVAMEAAQAEATADATSAKGASTKAKPDKKAKARKKKH